MYRFINFNEKSENMIRQENLNKNIENVKHLEEKATTMEFKTKKKLLICIMVWRERERERERERDNHHHFICVPHLSA